MVDKEFELLIISTLYVIDLLTFDRLSVSNTSFDFAVSMNLYVGDDTEATFGDEYLDDGLNGGIYLTCEVKFMIPLGRKL